MNTFLDVRGLPPCEPFDKILAAADDLPDGDELEVLIHREPKPLYNWLIEHGFLYRAVAETEQQFRIFIKRMAN